jgi:hypothetical protein
MLAKLSSAAVAPAPEISMAAAGETAAASGRPVTATSPAQAMARKTFKAFALSADQGFVSLRMQGRQR